MSAARDFYLEARQAAWAGALPPYRLAQIEALTRFLVARGVAPDDPRVRHYLAPLLALSDERQLFAAHRPAGMVDSMPAAAPPPAEEKDLAARIGDWWRDGHWKQAWPAVAAGLALLVQSDSGFVPPAAEAPLPPRDGAAQAGATVAGEFEQIPQHFLNWPLLVLAGTFVTVLLGVHLAWPAIRRWLARRRRQRLRRDPLPDRGALVSLATRRARVRLFADGDIAQAFRKLRRHRAVPSRRIDVRASIRSTIAGGAWATVRFARRRLSPDYLLLSERERPHDHLAEVATAWRERLNGAGIECEHYEFFGAPNTVRQVATATGRACKTIDMRPLDVVLAGRERAHAVVMMESFDAMPDRKRVPGWLTTAGSSVRLHQMNPREKRHWDGAEAQLHALGMQGFPASVAGSGEFADQVVLAIDAEDESQAAPETPAQPDLAAFFDAHRDLVLAPVRPTDLQVAQIVDTLERWLDPKAYLWLRALALFPVVNSGFTFFAGAVLEDETLVSHQRYLAIARLPWMRAATMPDWLRLTLIETFTAAQLARAAATAAAFLDPPRGALEIEDHLVELRRAAEDPKRMKRLADRLEGGLGGYNDRLLIEALKGHPPDRLAVILKGDFQADSRAPWWRSEPILLMAAGLLGTASLVALAPPAWRDYSGLAPMAPRQGKPILHPTQTPGPLEKDAQPPVVAPNTPPASSEVATPAPSPVVDPRSQPLKAFKLYIQYADPAQVYLADSIRTALSGQRLSGLPLVVPPLELRQGTSPRQTQLRCFDGPGCRAASELLDRLKEFGGAELSSPRPEDMTDLEARIADGETVGEPGHIELWLGAAGATPSPPSPEQSWNVAVVYFDYDRIDLNPEGVSSLNQFIKGYPGRGWRITVTCEGGDTNSRGYTVGLTARFATSVIDYLTSHGIPEEVITSEARGAAGIQKMALQNGGNRCVVRGFAPDAQFSAPAAK